MIYKYHRTMCEAFGPYTDNVLHPMNDHDDDLNDFLFDLVLCFVAGFCIGALILVI